MAGSSDSLVNSQVGYGDRLPTCLADIGTTSDYHPSGLCLVFHINSILWSAVLAWNYLGSCYLSSF